LATILAMLAGSGAVAQDNRDRLFVSVDWLAGHLQDPDLVILQVARAEDYRAAHIAGARHLLLNAMTAPSVPGGLTVEFPPDSMLERQLEDLGLSNSSLPVVVAGKGWGASALRVFSTLYYAGLGDRAVMLDGGIEAWVAAGQPVTTDIPPPRRGALTLAPKREFVVDADFVRSHASLTGWAVVDARGQPFYDGVQNSRFGGEDSGRPGHIPGALSLGMSELWRDDHFKSTAELRSLFEQAGIRPGDTVVAYCHVGVYANSVLTAARILGNEVRLYDGSFHDWAIRGLPLATEATRR